VEYADADEVLCETVASLVQFPTGYLERVRDQIRGRTAAIQVNTLKAIASENHHVVYGLVKAMERHGIRLDLDSRAIHGSDGNLRKMFPTVESHLQAKTAEDFLSNIEALSPYFMRVLRSKAGNVTLRTLSNLLDLGSVQDAKEIRGLLRETDPHARAV
jgi:hypothetical protein